MLRNCGDGKFCLINFGRRHASNLLNALGVVDGLSDFHNTHARVEDEICVAGRFFVGVHAALCSAETSGTVTESGQEIHLTATARR